MDVATGAGVVSAAFAAYESLRGTVNDLREKSKELKDQDLAALVTSMYDELTELKIQLDIVAKENQELIDVVNFKNILAFKAPLYFAEGDETPYCPKCWEGKRQQIHLVVERENGHFVRCPVCEFSHWITIPRYSQAQDWNPYG